MSREPSYEEEGALTLQIFVGRSLPQPGAWPGSETRRALSVRPQHRAPGAVADDPAFLSLPWEA